MEVEVFLVCDVTGATIFFFLLALQSQSGVVFSQPSSGL